MLNKGPWHTGALGLPLLVSKEKSQVSQDDKQDRNAEFMQFKLID